VLCRYGLFLSMKQIINLGEWRVGQSEFDSRQNIFTATRTSTLSILEQAFDLIGTLHLLDDIFTLPPSHSACQQSNLNSYTVYLFRQVAYCNMGFWQAVRPSGVTSCSWDGRTSRPLIFPSSWIIWKNYLSCTKFILYEGNFTPYWVNENVGWKE
jgi:hypothetical protein